MQLKSYILFFTFSALSAGKTFAGAVPDSGQLPSHQSRRPVADSLQVAARASFRDSGTVVITLQHAGETQAHIDSVYLIMDQYDRRGAGVVKKVYYPVNNQVTVTVRKGRYYASIYCLGRYNRASFDRVLTIRPVRRHEVKLRMQVLALFTPGQAEMPKERWDPSHLAIMEKKR